MPKTHFNQNERTDFVYLDGFTRKLDQIIDYKANLPANKQIVQKLRSARTLTTQAQAIMLEQMPSAIPAVEAELKKYTIGVIHTREAQVHSKKLMEEERKFRQKVVAEQGPDIYLDAMELLVANICKRCNGGQNLKDGGCPARRAFEALDIGVVDPDHKACTYAYREHGGEVWG